MQNRESVKQCWTVNPVPTVLVSATGLYNAKHQFFTLKFYWTMNTKFVINVSIYICFYILYNYQLEYKAVCSIALGSPNLLGLTEQQPEVIILISISVKFV